ncbi:hypothetical protein EV644_10389 [Kribbella orskensis]|uniref:HNH endonuclease n=1 Tax=Kribbella orskensis TaxID=2512216 RepID=A0ABY2BRK9_9ACTN|nr:MULTISPECIES: hypothetical protein [Kribbella]TCN39825.1 hypothetical protein EV642_106331 [Kribbella sp. VKM Ac-2500]TCO27392.1 hypothetical protein EV644_10389 [Kribbella orskensis]
MSGAFEPFRPPMVGAEMWQTAMAAAGWVCECTGQCGKTHAKTAGRCGVAHGSAHTLAVVAADPTVSLRAAVTGAELVALCAGCQSAIKRAATNAAEQAAAARADQLDLFDLIGGEAA